MLECLMVGFVMLSIENANAFTAIVLSGMFLLLY
jgi:hypothetical protein